MKLVLQFLFAILFISCSSEPAQKPQSEPETQAQVPLSDSENNTTIDENYPPIPAMERE